MLSRAETYYAEASQTFQIAERYQMNYEFWKVVHGVLMDEADMHTAHKAEFDRESRLIQRRIDYSLKMWKTLRRRGERIMTKYHEELKREQANGKAS